jgi:hypothetical protein
MVPTLLPLLLLSSLSLCFLRFFVNFIDIWFYHFL